MRRCPNCGSEMIIVEEHCIKVKYKIVGGKRSKNPVIQKPSTETLLNTKAVCQNSGCRYTEECY